MRHRSLVPSIDVSSLQQIQESQERLPRGGRVTLLETLMREFAISAMILLRLGLSLVVAILSRSVSWTLRPGGRNNFISRTIVV